MASDKLRKYLDSALGTAVANFLSISSVIPHLLQNLLIYFLLS